MQDSSSSCGKPLSCFVFIVVLLFTSSNSKIVAGVSSVSSCSSSSSSSSSSGSTSSSSTEHHLVHNEHYSNETSPVASAILVFGDSTVDPGNNNYIKTMATSNFLPYGRDLAPDHMPTGRFCNGKLITDFTASHLGLKELVPPYLDTTLSFQELMTGVSFASASTGYDPVTALITDVISIPKQLDYFREYKTKLQTVLGKKETENHIRKAIVVISAGTNDFVVNYFGLQLRSKTFTISEYQKFLIDKVQEFLQGLSDLGARKILVVGIPPIGCLPSMITMKSDIHNSLNRECLDKYSKVARDYNTKLQQRLVSIQQRVANQGSLIVYVDIYKPLQDIIDNYNKFGFEERKRGCCGTGLYEFSITCNPLSITCPEASKYIFWDAVHPTEKTYQTLFTIFRKIVDLVLAHK